MSLNHIGEELPPRACRKRLHTKSRKGCMMCKQRHIKCDETRPSCMNCTQRALSCHYTPSTSTSGSSRLPPLRIDHWQNSKKRPGRPRKYAGSPGVTASTSTTEDLNRTVASAPSEMMSALQHHLSLDSSDFELLHHYYTSTSTTFSPDVPIQSVYQTEIPRMALTHPFVLRLLLALAGQHMRHLHSETGNTHEADRYARLAEIHFCAAIPEVKRLFSEISRNNCRIAYISATLVCIHLLARGPMPGEYLIFNEQDPPLWIGLLQGVKHTNSIFGDLSSGWAKKAETQTTNMSTAVSFDLPRVQWQVPLRQLNSFIASDVEPESREVFFTALETLTQVFEATYGRDEDSSYEGDALQQIVFRWLYMLDDRVVKKLQEKEPHALIMVGYYAILLRVPELTGCWFVKGWSHHILRGTYLILDERYRCWLKWPFMTAGLNWEKT